MDIQMAEVGPNYLRTLQIPLVSGREFAPSDIDGSQPVAIVNVTFTNHYWPQQQAIGKKLKANGAWHTVVGCRPR